MLFNRVIYYVANTLTNLSPALYVLSLSFYAIAMTCMFIYYNIISAFYYVIVLSSIIRQLCYMHMFAKQIPFELYCHLHKFKLAIIKTVDIFLMISIPVLFYIDCEVIFLYLIAIMPLIDIIYKQIMISTIKDDRDENLDNLIHTCILNLITTNEYKLFDNVIFDKIKNIINDKNPFVLCSVCQDVINNDEHFAAKLNCSHIFHAKCIVMWLYKKLDCPICRKNVIRHDQMHIPEKFSVPNNNTITAIMMSDGLSGLFI